MTDPAAVQEDEPSSAKASEDKLVEMMEDVFMANTPYPVKREDLPANLLNELRTALRAALAVARPAIEREMLERMAAEWPNEVCEANFREWLDNQLAAFRTGQPNQKKLPPSGDHGA